MDQLQPSTNADKLSGRPLLLGGQLDRIRLWKEGVRDLVMEICWALHNFHVRLTL